MSGHVQERFIDTATGFHILKEQDCEAIIKAIKAAPEHMARRMNTQNASRYVGSVPNILAVSWAKEWGVPLYSKEWQKLAARRLKHDPNWSKLRAEYN